MQDLHGRHFPKRLRAHGGVRRLMCLQLPAQTVCSNVSVCLPGTHILTLPTPGADIQCQACVLGTSFSTASNASSCTGITNCQAGYQQQTAPTTSTDRMFVDCPL